MVGVWLTAALMFLPVEHLTILRRRHLVVQILPEGALTLDGRVQVVIHPRVVLVRVRTGILGLALADPQAVIMVEADQPRAIPAKESVVVVVRG